MLGASGALVNEAARPLQCAGAGARAEAVRSAGRQNNCSVWWNKDIGGVCAPESQLYILTRERAWGAQSAAPGLRGEVVLSRLVHRTRGFAVRALASIPKLPSVQGQLYPSVFFCDQAFCKSTEKQEKPN